MIMKLSKQGIDFIKSFEGCRLEAYHGAADRPGLYTIGYGHTGKVQKGQKITQAEADRLFSNDVAPIEKQLNFYPRPLVIGRVSFEYVNKNGKKIIYNGLRALREALFEDYACDRCPPKYVEAKAWITLSERITKPGKQYRESVCD